MGRGGEGKGQNVDKHIDIQGHHLVSRWCLFHLAGHSFRMLCHRPAQGRDRIEWLRQHRQRGGCSLLSLQMQDGEMPGRRREIV